MVHPTTAIAKAVDRASSVAVVAVVCFVAWSVATGSRSSSTQAAQAPRAATAVDPGTTIILSPRSNVPPGATGALIEFTDFECPYCGTFARETAPKIRHDYVETGRLAYDVNDFPLEATHRFALDAAVAARCATAQGQYWPMHDRLFANQRALHRDQLVAVAGELGMEPRPFQRCMDASARDEVRADQAAGLRLGVKGTPSFFLGRIASDRKTVEVNARMTGTLTYDDFVHAIDELLEGRHESFVTRVMRTIGWAR